MDAFNASFTNSTTSSPPAPERGPMFHAADTLRDVYIWIVFVLGLPGSGAAVATILSMRVTTATFYVALLAVADGVTLILKLIFHQMSTYFVLPHSGMGCRILNMIVELSSCYANWVLVLVCFERFVSVRFPLKKNVFFTKTRAYVSGAALYLVMFLCFSHYLYSNNYCEGGDTFYNGSWLWIQSALYFLVPFVIVAILTVAIVICLRRYRRARQQMQSTANGDDGSTERAISIMLVSAAIVFLILALPTCVYYLIDDAQMDEWGFTVGDKYMFFEVTTFLADATHAVNFYVYFFSAAKFRHRFLELIGIKEFPPCIANRASASSSSGTQYSDLPQSKENMNAVTAV
ncbi:hypothetical protein BaRGS_00000289 [Batillaria attramentaria]|uniref:G-protein coupled receptors family 1 profile domain-containing protein n=1 Tax=Batillaria attramentaria TaxID=370345 RepID=A0ABD0MBV8_9CAEN